MVRNVLEVLWAASTLPRVQKELSESTMVWETDQEAEDDDEEESGRESGYKAIRWLEAFLLRDFVFSALSGLSHGLSVKGPKVRRNTDKGFFFQNCS